jgi:hypothetical protein
VGEISTPQMRWQHAMMQIADQPDALPGLVLSDPGERTDASDREEYVDRSGVPPSIVTPDGIGSRRSWRRRLRRLGVVIIVLMAIAGTVVVARLVLIHWAAEEDTALAESSTDQQVGPVEVGVPDGLDRSDCSDPSLVTTCVLWQEGAEQDGEDDSHFFVQVANLGSRLDEAALRSVLPGIVERLGASSTVRIADPAVTVGDNRKTITAEISVDGVEGRVTVVALGRWTVAVLAAGPEGYLEWHDAVVASARRD